MITATLHNGQIFKVDRLANRGQWFGETYFIGIGIGYDIHRVVVEADNESDAIDALTDSSYGHLIKTDELCKACQEDDFDNCSCSYAGNYSNRVDLDELRILEPCKVNYFAPKNTECR